MDLLKKNESASGYRIILSPQELSLPLSLSDLPETVQRVELEIGFGNGEYTVHRARTSPGLLLFGMEVSFSCVQKCAKRARGIDNLRILRTDARYMMKELFPDESLDRVYMNFPCPWPKNRHAHRRVTAREFVDDLAAVLKVGGIFELVSDDLNYSNEVRSRLSAHEALELQDDETNPDRPVTTKYERKWLEQGKDIYRLTFVKTRGFTVARRTWKENAMHIKTLCPPTEAFVASLSGTSGREGDARWSFGGYFTSGGKGEPFLVSAFATDDELEQRYYLRISSRDGGSLIQLDSTASAFLTPAVRLSIQDVAARMGGSSAKQ